MVDAFNTTSLSRSQLDGIATSKQEKLMRIEKQNSLLLQRSQWSVGWLSRNNSRFRSRQNFVL